jgi:hypothetical protein
LTAILLLVLIARPLGGQTPPTEKREIAPLPATTGAPLTVVPLDSPDIECSIQEWKSTAEKPYLKLLCPPENAYAPVRVYLKLSWLKMEDVAKDLNKIVIRPKQSTRIRSNQTGVLVRMEISSPDGRPQMKWVEFNGVVDLALLTDSRHR